MRARIERGEPLDARSFVVTAESLARAAPTAEAAARAHLTAGLALDVVQGQAEPARPHYEHAAQHGDDYVTAYALRHLGVLAHTSQDEQTARALWHRCLMLRQRCGHLTGAAPAPWPVSWAEVPSTWGSDLPTQDTWGRGPCSSASTSPATYPDEMGVMSRFLRSGPR